ncbi:glycosyltransferase [Seohaeicola zhoushanensis]|uniref:Glycosyltransferase subfamily 4-like N-terminal domain-containing protein n=1 Tax=Seohaeicola zhoushanensis TaxID=1569283 RepID=A0A8J3H026_9RHOB|nr:glycosyltransferase [Seohaeicola zhoushanensis]GHF59148.1 hypothetical protein GCM10017056_33320 [Seohaeicola zhoushanensis]
MIRVLHLIDDTTPGGVTRYLEFIRHHPAMTGVARHQIRLVTRNRLRAERVTADIVVSHLAISWRGLPQFMALRAANPKVPLIHVEHSYCEGFVAARVSKRDRFYTLLRCSYSLFDRVVAVSEGQAGWFNRHRLVAADALAVIPPCVDLSAFRALDAPTGPVDVIGAFGRLDQQKGFDLLIRAYRQVKGQAVLRIHGEGPERAALEALAEGDRRIQFTGFVADPAAAMAQCDAVVMPSRWEPYGIVALEALTARRPLLTSPVDGLNDHRTAGAQCIRGASVEVWADALRDLVNGRTGALNVSPFRTPEQTTAALWQKLLEDIAIQPRTSGTETPRQSSAS